MANSQFVDVCRFNPTAGGTTDWTYSSAVTGYQSPALAGVVNGAQYSYRAESSDLSQWENGYGTYNTGTGVLTRTTVLYNSAGTGLGAGQSGAGSKISFSVAPQVAIVALAEDLYRFPRGYLSGLTLSTAGSSTTFTVAPGDAVDGTQTGMMQLASSINKTTSTWVVGSGNGALDTGSISASTWYHVHLIRRQDTQVVDVLISLSPSAPTMPSGYTLSRRIGSMKTNGSSQWTAFTQIGNEFYWTLPIGDLTGSNPGTTPTLTTLTVPTGINVKALFNTVYTSSGGAGHVAYVWSPLTGSSVAGWPSGAYVTINQGISTYGEAPCAIWANTSAQVYITCDAASGNSVIISTYGWIDTRGQDSAVTGIPAQISLPTLLQGYINGLTLSTAGSSTTFSVAGGSAVDANNTAFMVLSSALSKTTSAWAVGTGNGGLDTGSIAASTWYHVYLIERLDTQVVDVIVSLSASAPTLPANYTLYRRIGSMKTNGSSQWTKFLQIGNEFLWDAVVQDANGAAVGTTPTLATVSVPPGVNVRHKGNLAVTNTVTGILLVYSGAATSAQAAGTPSGHGTLYTAAAGSAFAAGVETETNTSAQLNVVASVASGVTYFILTTGWIDTRGGPTMATPAVQAGAAGGLVNKIRNGTMDIWQRGTSFTPAFNSYVYTADGWTVYGASASVTVTQAAGRLLTKNSLKITGATSVTDAYLEQKIESNIAAAMTSQTCTFQAWIFNNTGASITPTFYVQHTATPDNWASPVADYTVSLQTCPNGAWTQVAYTFTASSLAANGLRILVEFGNVLSTSGKSVQITECDLRVTPNVPVGLNSAPPAAELRDIQTELNLCQRYYETGTEPYNYNGGGGSITTAYGMVPFITPKRAAPTIGTASWQYWTGGSGAAFTPGSITVNSNYFTFQGTSLTAWNGWLGTGTWTATAEL